MTTHSWGDEWRNEEYISTKKSHLDLGSPGL